jgi:phosphatidylserine decarboxylase
MRLPFAKYGWPQVILFPAAILAAMILALFAAPILLPLWASVSVVAVLAVVLIWTLSFFRDPHRACPPDKNLLLAPADGRITDIEIVEEDSYIGSPALRIGIFLSIFDAHINRAPCNVRVESVTYRPGDHRIAANPKSCRANESNDLALIRTDSPNDRLIVRQISGAVARHIVCKAAEGQKMAGGEKFGMIKFGSRTELYVPVSENAKCLVRIGDKVKAGVSPLVRYEYETNHQQ